MVGYFRDQPARPAWPSGSPADTGTEKSSEDPSKGTERKNIPTGQTAGTLPRQRPTPLGAPPAIHFTHLCGPRPTRAPEGQNPKHPRNHQRTHVRHPFHVATRPATTQGGIEPSNRRQRQMAKRNLTPGGTPSLCRRKQNHPSPGGIHHLLRLHFLRLATASILLTQLRKSDRARTTHHR